MKWHWEIDKWHGGYSGLYEENNIPVLIPQHENDGDEGAAWFNTDGDAGDETLTKEHASLIASAPELKAERDRYLEALEKISSTASTGNSEDVALTLHCMWNLADDALAGKEVKR
jgi:hypothetical protein